MEREQPRDRFGDAAIRALFVASTAAWCGIFGAWIGICSAPQISVPQKVLWFMLWFVALVGYFVAGVGCICANRHGVWRPWSKLCCVAVSLPLGMLSYQGVILTFIKVGPSKAEQNARDCRYNLKHLNGAIDQLALESHFESGTPIGMAQLLVYCRSNTIPNCPLGGIYKVTRFGEPPTCTIPGHQL